VGECFLVPAYPVSPGSPGQGPLNGCVCVLNFSSSNAKKWEQDMQILRNNNARLTSALQESNTNVDEWKVQLAAYKDENSRMKAKVLSHWSLIYTL